MPNYLTTPQLIKANHAPHALNIVEQKIKATYSLTRKEYDNFNISILWLIGLMFEHNKDYRMVSAVSNFHEVQTLESFSNTCPAEGSLDEELTKWNEHAHVWSEEFREIFVKRFSNFSKYSFKYDNYYNSLDLVEANQGQNFSWTKVNKILPPLTTFNRSHPAKIVERIKYGYNVSDAEKLHSFIAWHNSRACLYYGFIEDAKGWMLLLKPETLTVEENNQALAAVKNFVNIIDFMIF